MNFFEVLGEFFSTTVTIRAEQFPFTWGRLLLQFVLPVVVYIVFYKLILLLVRRIRKISKENKKSKDKAYAWIRRILIILFVILLGILVGVLFGARIFQYLGRFFQVLSKPLFESGNTKISVITIILAIPIFYLASWPVVSAQV